MKNYLQEELEIRAYKRLNKSLQRAGEVIQHNEVLQAMFHSAYQDQYIIQNFLDSDQYERLKNGLLEKYMKEETMKFLEKKCQI